ncbi:unnamed protein product [Triticum turgidum subsp. durum]|uniref:Uncharacterized protein n=1 Tax=Triticum turgidum subsp. durum TaxID=4567 RepID=A0A9R0QBX9_TRITD|nr:unnamed protein product [Triticum turgidum subsp. durum]
MPQNIGDQTSEAQLVTRLTHWGFAWSILEMFSGVQTWCAKSPDEIYQSVVLKKEKPRFLYNLPTEVANVLSGCYEFLYISFVYSNFLFLTRSALHMHTYMNKPYMICSFTDGLRRSEMYNSRIDPNDKLEVTHERWQRKIADIK